MSEYERFLKSHEKLPSEETLRNWRPKDDLLDEIEEFNQREIERDFPRNLKETYESKQ